MADRIQKDPFDDEITKDVFKDAEREVKCPQCGGIVAANAKYCKYCGSKLETVDDPKDDEEVENVFEEEKKPAAPKKPRYDEHHRLIREDGDEAPKENFVSSKDYKYGDGKGHSVSTLSMYTLGAAFFIPVIPFIFAILGLATKNDKDKKLFKAATVVNLIVTIVEIVLLYLKITGKIN